MEVRYTAEVAEPEVTIDIEKVCVTAFPERSLEAVIVTLFVPIVPIQVVDVVGDVLVLPALYVKDPDFPSLRVTLNPVELQATGADGPPTVTL